MKTYITGLPTSQEQMEEWQEKYKFDPKHKTAEQPTGSWYEPVSVDDLTGGGAALPDLGTLPPADTKEVDTALNNAASSADLLAKQIAQQEKDRKALEKTLEKEGVKGKSVLEKILDLGGKKPKIDTAAQLAEEQEKYKVLELLEKTQAQNIKVATIQGDLTKMENLHLADIQRSYDQRASMGFIRGDVNEKTRKYNIDRSYKVAEMAAEAMLAQAYAGNLSEARGLANDAVNSYLFDIKQQRADFDAVFDIYGDWVSSLEAKDQDILNQARADLEAEEKRVREDKTNVLNLMLNYSKAGITIDDTVEEATAKASAWTGVQPTEMEEWKEKELFKKGLEPAGVSESKEFTRVKQIISQHPNEWGHAADQIDREFGKGTATKYDDYLKDVYQGGDWTSEVEQNFINLGIDQSLIDMAKAAGLKPDDLF